MVEKKSIVELVRARDWNAIATRVCSGVVLKMQQNELELIADALTLAPATLESFSLEASMQGCAVYQWDDLVQAGHDQDAALHEGSNLPLSFVVDGIRVSHDNQTGVNRYLIDDLVMTPDDVLITNKEQGQAVTVKRGAQ